LEGRIENIGKIPIIGLLAKYTLFDEDGRTLTIEECEITPDTILPGEKGRYMHNFRITGGHLRSYVCWFITKNGHEFEYLEGSGEEEPVFFYEMDIEEAAADINLPPVPFESYVIPLHEDIRNTTLTLLSDVPKDINSDAASWKIWKIHNWVANNIKYVSDPFGFEYMAYPYETLESKAGDCDDYAVLLASMYESSGLDAMIAFVDVSGDSKVDHVTCLIYYPQSATSFLEEEEIIINSQGMSYPLGKQDLEYILGTDTLIPDKTSDAYDDYQEGIWIVADPPFAIETSMVGYILHKPYVILAVSDVGS
ncbi:MAG: hypothetical protein AMJ70_03845, partial [Dehalococcoidia bacterium SG8_51_3]